LSSRNKRTVQIHGKGTSVNIEPVVWEAVKTWARTRGINVSALVEEIADNRKHRNLSSAIRVAVLEHYKRGHYWKSPRAT
jgi:predicted DNA-binding ribbon-helix-helix protein